MLNFLNDATELLLQTRENAVPNKFGVELGGSTRLFMS